MIKNLRKLVHKSLKLQLNYIKQCLKKIIQIFLVMLYFKKGIILIQIRIISPKHRKMLSEPFTPFFDIDKKSFSSKK